MFFFTFRDPKVIYVRLLFSKMSDLFGDSVNAHLSEEIEYDKEFEEFMSTPDKLSKLFDVARVTIGCQHLIRGHPAQLDLWLGPEYRTRPYLHDRAGGWHQPSGRYTGVLPGRASW